MKLTTRGYYSVKALLDISLQPRWKPIAVKAIAHRQNIPAPYLEKLLIEMRKAGILESVRGREGGYQLKRSAADISLGQILAAVGENLSPFPDHDADESHPEDWVTYTLWQRLAQNMKTTLYNITLEDLYYDARSWQASQGDEANFIV